MNAATKFNYRATLTNGTVVTRKSHRVYTHVIEVNGTPSTPVDVRGPGVLNWCGSLALASKAAQAARVRGFLNVEIIPCEIA